MTEINAVPRFDFFQTATQVIVSVYVKGCSKDDVQLDTSDQSLRLTINAPSKANLEIAPLFGPIDSSNSGITTLPSKVEISLQKEQPGIQWPSLQGNHAGGSVPTIIDVNSDYSQTNSHPISSARARSKWDSFKDDEEEDDDDQQQEGKDQNKISKGAGSEKDGSIDDFFKQLYANADDDTRRAMMKSYQESGGTHLSTNWEDVKKGKVKTEPPQGMEARKW